MRELGLAIATLVIGAASMFAAVMGARALARNRRLRGQPLRDVRSVAGSACGRLVLVLLALAVVSGVVGGCLLADRVEEGKERRLEQRQS